LTEYCSIKRKIKALVFSEKGKAADVLTLSDTELDAAQPNEITIRTLASPINPNDFMFIEKQYRLVPTFPQIVGFEGCGIVTDNNGNADIPSGSLVAFRHKNVWVETMH
jgi:NADPH:quinone reductase-like Zn-dependent oxidoreductase